MIKMRCGDIFESQAQTLVNTVNCVGVMGKGIALLFKRRYPYMFQDYVRRCKNNLVQPGIPYHYTDAFGNSIVNFPTKNHWRSPSYIEDIIKGLDFFVTHYKEWGIESVAFPPLGCGNGGQEWRIVGRIMYEKLSKIDIPVEIYAPFGTPKEELSEEFLSQKVLLDDYNQLNLHNNELTPDKLAVLEVLNRLEKQTHALKVGRVLFQKICFIITESGLKTGFNFQKGYYGPYSSKDVNQMILLFANNNLITEHQLGNMIVISTGHEYDKIRSKYLKQLTELEPYIEKTVDLFSRIKNTEQAEEVTTVYYAYKELEDRKTGHSVSEQELFDYILTWKKKWSNAEKRQRLASAIRNLAIMKWIQVTFSNSLPTGNII